MLPSSGAVFVGVERPELWASKAEVEAIVAGSTEVSATLVFAGPPSDFTGETSPRARAGHIPGSVSVPAVRLADRSTKALLKGDALREKFVPALASDPSRVVTYCGSGIAAASAALALAVLGEERVAVYDGSLNEWAADPDAPLQTLV